MTEVDPAGSGLLADGDVGVGRLADPVDIADAVEARLAGAGTLAGRRVLVSAGGTREPIDPVRYVGNRSSGRMGWAVAEAARRRGAEVTVLASNVDLPRHADIRYVDAPTAADLHARRPRRVPGLRRAGDGRRRRRLPPRGAARGQDRQGRRGRAWRSTWSRPPTSSPTSPARRERQVLVGFAAEHGPAGLERARAKRVRKGLDLIVHNDVSVRRHRLRLAARTRSRSSATDGEDVARRA